MLRFARISKRFLSAFETPKAAAVNVGSLDQAAPIQLKPPTPKEMVKYFDRHVIGQEAAKKVIAIAVYNHYCRMLHKTVNTNGNFLEKCNIMLIGPSGTGKTLLAKTAAQILDVPFSMSDATGLTEAGYVGEDVDLLLFRLLEKAGFNLKHAQRGIVFLDEVDKLARSTPNPAIGNKDVGGQGVQQGLLKMIEGTIVDVKDRRKGERSAIPFDTSSILFIFSGAFNGLEEIVNERISKVPLGFSLARQTEGLVERQSWKNDLLSSDLVTFGLIPEFVGRIPVVAPLDELDQECLERILVEPENSLIAQYQQLFALNRTSLSFSKDAITEIAKMAIRLQVGARGLRSILERILMPWMYEVPRSNFASICFCKDSVCGRSKPKVTFHTL